MNTFKSFATIALFAVITSSLTAQHRGYSASAGNSNMGADLTFGAYYWNGNHPTISNYFAAGGHFYAGGTVFGQQISVIDIEASATNTNNSVLEVRIEPVIEMLRQMNPSITDAELRAMRVIQDVPLEDRSEAVVHFSIGDQDYIDVSHAYEVSHTEEESFPLKGITKSFNVGPFAVEVNAGLYAWGDVTLSASLDFLNLEASGSAGFNVGVTCGVDGGISAGPLGGIELTATCTLASLGATLFAELDPSGPSGSLEITAEAARVLLELRCWLFSGLGSWTLTLVDKSLASWSKNIPF